MSQFGLQRLTPCDLMNGPPVNPHHSREVATGLNLARGVSRRASDRLRYPLWMAWAPLSLNFFIIEKDEFYILRSKESIKIKNDQAAELEPFKDSFGNFRVHYAGFFDPGFGNNKYGTPAVLELRAYDTPFIIRDGQLVGQLNYYEIDKIKKNSYGFNIKSNYFNQNLKLAKQFK